jgi:hypothetical protein
MMSIRKIAAQAALLLSLFLAATIVVWMGVIPSLGMANSDWNVPAKSAQFMIDHKSVFTLAYFFDWIFGITTFILAAAYTQRFSRHQPWLGIVIGGTGVMSSLAFLLAGTVGIYGVHIAALDYANGHSLSLAMFTQQVEFWVSQSAVGIVGVMVLAVARASARTKAFAGWANSAAYLTGVCFTLGFIVGAANMMIGMPIMMLGLVADIFFNVGVAMSFMKQEHPELVLAPAN